jgi:hypothetical protein
MRGTPYSGNFEGICANPRLAEVLKDNTGKLMFIRTPEAVPQKTAKST